MPLADDAMVWTLPNDIFCHEIQYGDFIIDDWFQALNWPTFGSNYCAALRSEKSHTSYTIDTARARPMQDIFTLFIIARFPFVRLFISH